MLTKPPKTGVDLEQGQGSSWPEHSEDFHRCGTHPGALKSALITPGINYINFSDNFRVGSNCSSANHGGFLGSFPNMDKPSPLSSSSWLGDSDKTRNRNFCSSGEAPRLGLKGFLGRFPLFCRIVASCVLPAGLQSLVPNLPVRSQVFFWFFFSLEFCCRIKGNKLPARCVKSHPAAPGKQRHIPESREMRDSPGRVSLFIGN